MLNLGNDTIKSSEKGEFTLGILVDLSKAFDTVNHDILLTKLHNYVIKENYFFSCKNIENLLIVCKTNYRNFLPGLK